jgi:glycosyltransferase involved in cell wall biosynthesis
MDELFDASHAQIPIFDLILIHPPVRCTSYMRVLFLKGLSAWALGGDRTETLRLVRGAADQGCIVALGADAVPKELAGIPHFKVEYPQTAAVEGQVRTAIDVFRPDVVHVIGAGIRFMEAFDRVLRNARWAFTAHNVPPAEKIFSCFFAQPRLYYAARNTLAMPSVRRWSRFLRHASFAKVICHSDTVSRRLISRGCDVRKIVNISFGCDPPVLDSSAPSPLPATSSPKIVTVAGFAPHKGQLDAIRAMARLLPQFPNLAYRMIGNPRPDERYARFIQHQVQRLALQGNVALLEDASEQTKHAALRDADLYLQPSHEEGFCIAFLEAAQVVPRLVGTDTGAIAAMAEGDSTARIVRPGNVAALAHAMGELLRTAPPPHTVERRREMLASRYSWTNYAGQHVKAYQSM